MFLSRNYNFSLKGKKKMPKVNLDALIPREDFEIADDNKEFGTQTTTLKITDLENNAFLYQSLRKPDFQRETSEWDSEKVKELIESFVNGDLIPAVILWRSPSGYTFIVDGSHRLGALIGWVNNDYGDGDISKKFFEGIIPETQINIADRTRILIRKSIGHYSDYKLALSHPDKVDPNIVKNSKRLGTLAIQLQWVNGNADCAENSFFKINQQAQPINPTELLLLKSRKCSNCIASRAIMRSGTGHKYWSGFSPEVQRDIEQISKEINDILFIPALKTPIKSLDLPIGGKLYTAQTLPMILNFVNIVNGISLNGDYISVDNKLIDEEGKQTIQFLKNVKRIANRINSNHPSSLGLHPAFYLYSQEGRYKIASFYAVVSLMLEFDDKNKLDKFIKTREMFEDFLLKNDYLIQQIVRVYRSGIRAYPVIKEFYLAVMETIDSGIIDNDEIKETILKMEQFKNLTIKPEEQLTENPEFTVEIKSKVFMQEAMKNAIKCKICKGYLHRNSISFDHIKRKEDGGVGSLDNAQMAHPYCNTTIKQ